MIKTERTSILDTLSEWQTLIAAIIALIAALLTVIIMHRQTKHQINDVADKARRKNLSARAHMPDALSRLHAYIKSASRYIENPDLDYPEPPTDQIGVLKSSIEHIDVEAAEKAFRLITKYQIHRSRLDSYRDNNRFSRQADLQYDVILLMAYTNDLFDYGRGEDRISSIPEPSHSEMQTAASNVLDTRLRARFYDPADTSLAELRTLIDRRHN